MLDAPTFGLVSGAALIGTAVLRVTLSTQRRQRRRLSKEAVSTERRERFGAQLNAALQWARASQPGLKAWSGTRDFQVVAIVDEAADCRSYHLAPVDARPLARYLPGQYLTFHLPSRDPQRPTVRCYSLSDRSREDQYRVTVKRVLPPQNQPQLPPGQGSNYFHERVGVGSLLQCEAPQGSFFLDPTEKTPLVLIGGGIGITPLMSIVATLAAQGSQREIWLFAGYRNAAEQPFRHELSRCQQQLANLQVRTAYSAPSANEQLGRDYDLRGRLDSELIRSELPSSNYRYFVCGPAGMMQTLVPALWEWGVPRDHVHFEAFGPATIRGFATEVESACQVQFARSGKTATWEAADETLLDMAERAGVDLPSGCRAGNCGQCRMQLVAGRIAHLKPPGVELVDGECLACIAVPKGDVVLDA